MGFCEISVIAGTLSLGRIGERGLQGGRTLATFLGRVSTARTSGEGDLETIRG